MGGGGPDIKVMSGADNFQGAPDTPEKSENFRGGAFYCFFNAQFPTIMGEGYQK
jgi:hypothetical protein